MGSTGTPRMLRVLHPIPTSVQHHLRPLSISVSVSVSAPFRPRSFAFSSSLLRSYRYRFYSSCSTTDTSNMAKSKVAIVGSGNWGSAISKIIGENVKRHSDTFEEEVQMWVFEEKVDGRNLTEVINEKHENTKYLPGIKLPENVVAQPDIAKAVEGATTLVFVTPHQFIEKICADLKGKIPKEKVRAITLVKGVDVNEDRIRIFADVIEDKLGVSTCALSGANIANEVAAGNFCETTIGYRSEEDGKIFQKLFDTDNFRVALVNDVEGVSLCGALKNIVAIAAGFVDGLEMGNNTKSAIIRLGLLDMKNFAQEFFPNVKDGTFLAESCGVADVITSCFGGRNRKVAEAFVREKKPFTELEEKLLGGQKLQGTLTAEEVHRFLKARGREDAYPLFIVVHAIANEGYPAEKLTENL